MKVEPTPLAGLVLLAPERRSDERGFFARLWDKDAFAAAGLAFAPCQISVAFNARKGTLRGLHWQAEPHVETKLVSVTRGRIFDVAVDLRPDSPTHLAWFGTELDADAHTALLIPRGFAHGFLSLTDAAEVLYMIDAPYAPAAARGARWDDPALAIAWPGEPVVIAERDRSWPPVGALAEGA